MPALTGWLEAKLMTVLRVWRSPRTLPMLACELMTLCGGRRAAGRLVRFSAPMSLAEGLWGVKVSCDRGLGWEEASEKLREATQVRPASPPPSRRASALAALMQAAARPRQ